MFRFRLLGFVLTFGLLWASIPGSLAQASSAPTVVSVSPAGGSEDGGTFVTLVGTGFTDGNDDSIVSAVTVGGESATAVDVLSSTSLTFLTPAGTGSSNQVIVTTTNGSSSDAVTFEFEAEALFPTISNATPSSGSVAGGTDITVTGTGFVTGTKVFLGSQELTTVVDSATQLTATTPDRTGSNSDLTVGAQALQVRVPKTGTDFSGGYRASAEETYFSYAPELENPNAAGYAAGAPARVVLGTLLADRTQGKPLTKSGSAGAYTMSGFLGARITGKVDAAADYEAASRATYSYVTASNYSSTPNGNGREGYEVDNSKISSQSYSASLSGSEWQLNSSLNCGPHDNAIETGVSAYCTIFGPQLLSEPFYATAGQSISFTWKAQGGGDDYEVYAYLVEISGQSDYSFAAGDHTTILHSRGTTTAYTTTAAEIPNTGLYRFRFVNGSYDASGGKALGARMYIKTDVVLGRSNSITFGTIADRTDSDAFSVSASSTSTAEVEVAASGACTVSTSHASGVTTVTVTRSTISSDACTLVASQGQVGLYAPAASVSRTFNFPTVSVPAAPTSLSGSPGSGQLTISFTAGANGGSSITNYQYQLDGGSWVAFSPAVTSSPVTISGLTNGTEYSVKLRAVNARGNGTASSAVTATPAVPPSSERTKKPEVFVPEVAPTPTQPRFTVTPQSQLLPTSDGPVLRGGLPPAPPRAPQALVAGRTAVTTLTVPTRTELDLRAGTFNLGVKVQEDQGEISQTDDGVTEIAVRKGAAATITGSGFRPGATVQVFMPLQGDNAKELTRIPVQPDGSFDGSAPFATRSNEAPLPVGKNVLQLVSLDDDGNQVVVEMSVNIAQGAPAPEQNRIDGVIPTMTPGQSVATSGGEPVPVRITPVSEQKLAVVEGDGWTMAVNVAAEDGGVEPSEGGALLKLVRDESALISGSGFMPGTRADVWLFSDPTLLGTVTIDENGEFTGEVNIDPNVIPVGEHTLQLQGVGEDGYVKAANLGVLVDDAVEAVPTAVEQGLGFIWWIIAALVLLAVIVVLIASRRRRDA